MKKNAVDDPECTLHMLPHLQVIPYEGIHTSTTSYTYDLYLFFSGNIINNILSSDLLVQNVPVLFWNEELMTQKPLSTQAMVNWWSG